MRLFIALLLLVTFAVPASAEWVKVGTSDEIDQYVNADSVRNQGDYSTAWALQNLKERHPDGELSRQFLYECDCRKWRTRSISISTHSRHWAKGEVIMPNTRLPHAEWRYPPPDSVSEEIIKIICNK